MGIIARIYDFVAGTKIRSAEVDAEFNQLVAGHNDHDTKIDNLQVGTGLVDGSVVTIKLADGSVTTIKLADLSIVAAKIALGTITLAQVNLANFDSRYYTESEVDSQVALLETKSDLTTVRKLSATGDFTGTLNGNPIVSTDPGLSSTVSALLANYAKQVPKVFDVKGYGAVGDTNVSTGAGTDDTAAIRAAYNAAKLVHGVVYFPPDGIYKVTDTILIDSVVTMKGSCIWGLGSSIYTSMNKPIFTITDAATIDGIAFYGSNDVTKTLQDGIYASNVNAVTIKNNYFKALYNCIHVVDTVFYSTIENNVFASNKNAFFYGEGTSGPGYQITFNHNIAPAEGGKYGFYFANAGTVTINDLEMSPTNLTDSGVVFASNAPLAGLHQITHSRLEGSATIGLHIIGTALSPVSNLFVDNTYIAGNPSVKIEYGNGIFFNNTSYTGSADGATGRNAILIKYVGKNIEIANARFPVSNVPITAEATCTNISIDVTNPVYEGGLPFVYLPFLSASVISRVSINGGTVGSNATPIDLPTFNPTKVKLNIPGNFQKETWIAPALQNGWTNHSAPYSQAGYYKDNFGIVHIRGLLKGGTTAAATLLFTLPAGYRPLLTATFTALSSNGSAVVFVLEVGSAGTVNIGGSFAAGNSFMCLDGIQFPAEQ